MFSLENFVANRRSGDGQVENYISNETIDSMHFDPGLQRPYLHNSNPKGDHAHGQVWVDVTVGHEPIIGKDEQIVRNKKGEVRYRTVYDSQLVSDRMRRGQPTIQITSNATVLRKDQWILIDTVVKETARKRLTAWNDLRASNTFGGFDGMATPILEFEKITDVGVASVDFDGLSEGQGNAAPVFDLQGIPLPITHMDFWLSSRFLATSRRGPGQSQDRIRASFAARRVAETIEQTLIGTLTGPTYGDSTDYLRTSKVVGYTNHPDRLTSTGNTAPDGTNGTTVLGEWLTQREVLTAQNFFGPYTIYTATNWDQFLDDEFKTNSDKSLRNRLLEIEDIMAIKRLDYLTTANTTLWVEMGELIQAINGMELTTVQWESKGGMQLNFKVMAIQVPRIISVNINTGTTGPAVVSADKTPVLETTV